MGGTRWHFTIDDAQCPGKAAGCVWKTGIHYKKYDLISRNSHDAKHARLKLVRTAMAFPLRILKGWNRIGHDGEYVYVSKPEVDYRSWTVEVPAPKGMYFLVFVEVDGTIDDWAWRAEDVNDPDLPKDTGKEVVFPCY